MKSGVYYLYEYKNNQKSRNVGFLKFSQQSDQYILQICARGISVFHNEQASLSALFASNNKLSLSPDTPIDCENHAVTCRLNLPASIFVHPEPSDAICGFLLKLPNNQYIAAVEDGISFSPESLTCPTVEPAAPMLESCSSEPVPLTKESSFAKPIVPVSESYNTEPAPSASEPYSSIPMSPTSESLSAASISPTPEPCSAENSAHSSPTQTLRKIHRSELSVLPRQHWHLANNSFLLHGYHNYNHLLLINENGHTFLGVPGIYDKREARAARAFGFPVFSESYTKSLNLSSEESNPYGIFGYWCREIPIS